MSSSRALRLLPLGLLCGAMLLLAPVAYPKVVARTVSFHHQQQSYTCSTTSFDAGHWRVNAGPAVPRHCAFVDKKENKHNTSSYQWIPHQTCQLRHPSILEKLQSLVDRPLLVLGDSRSREHFEQLSCELNDGVRWEEMVPPQGVDKRFGHHHLYLDTASPLTTQLKLPRSFDVSKPLASYVMSYIPLSRLELRELEGVDTSIVPLENPTPDYPGYELDRNASLNIFAGPSAHYKTMLYSTGAHFGPALFRPKNHPVPEAIAIARAALQNYFAELARRMKPDQRVLVRAAEAGHADCDSYHEPLIEVDQMKPLYNYHYLADINDVLRDETRLLGDSRFEWIGTDRLVRMRPDAHRQGDCVHYKLESGVHDAVSRFMWHHLLGM